MAKRFTYVIDENGRAAAIPVVEATKAQKQSLKLIPKTKQASFIARKLWH